MTDKNEIRETVKEVFREMATEFLCGTGSFRPEKMREFFADCGCFHDSQSGNKTPCADPK